MLLENEALSLRDAIFAGYGASPCLQANFLFWGGEERQYLLTQLIPGRAPQFKTLLPDETLIVTTYIEYKP